MPYETTAPIASHTTSPGRTARELTARGAILLDVRTREEFHDEHLPGALNIPLQELAARLSELARARAVVVYCRSGKRSAAAARLLEQNGFAHVHDMGAMLEWARSLQNNQ
jgi:phage shock protein E